MKFEQGLRFCAEVSLNCSAWTCSHRFSPKPLALLEEQAFRLQPECLLLKQSERFRRETMATSPRTTIQAHLGAKAKALLEFHSPKIAKERLHLPGPEIGRA